MNEKKLSIRIASDMHLDKLMAHRMTVQQMADYFLPEDEKDKDSVMVLAGDISSSPTQLLAFLGIASERFKKVVFVPGNHEYYGHVMGVWDHEMTKIIREHLGHKVYAAIQYPRLFQIDDVSFIAGTLWADAGFTDRDKEQVGTWTDFTWIQLDYDKHWTPDLMRTHHLDLKQRMSKQLKFNDYAEGMQPRAKVVVSHHLPSRELVSERFLMPNGNDGSNGMFVGACDDLLQNEYTRPDVWIFGHTHDSKDQEVHGVRCVCNPMGYQQEWGTPENTYMRLSMLDGLAQAQVVPKFIEV